MSATAQLKKVTICDLYVQEQTWWSAAVRTPEEPNTCDMLLLTNLVVCNSAHPRGTQHL